MRVIELLKEQLFKLCMYFDGVWISQKELDKTAKELEKIIKENSEDRLAELEKVILDYYLAKGYRIGVGGWGFRVEIISFHKYKRIVVYFKEHNLVNSSFAFSTVNKSTKEMFDKAFEHFSLGN